MAGKDGSPSGDLTIDPEFRDALRALTIEERSFLESSIEAEGCRDPILVWTADEIIIDGHNRYDICCQLGIEFKVKRVNFDSRIDALLWIRRNQLGRRNETAEERAYTRGMIYEDEKRKHGGDRKSEESSGQNVHLKTAQKVAEEFGVDEKTIRRDAQYANAVDALAKNVSPELKTEILSGQSDLTKKAVVEIAALPAEEQPAAVEAAKVRRWSNTPTAAIVHDETPAEICTDLTDLITAGQRFGTIYADPPWRYDNSGTRGNVEGTYAGTMTVAEICAMPVAELAADASHCHLWTTNAFIQDAFEVLYCWGFEYKSMFVWVKPQMGMGNYWRVSHEIMLLGIRGDAKRFSDRSIKSWGEYDRREHSEKPDEVRSLIERVSPGPYLELFGRKSVTGWTVFGNQVERMLV